MKNIVLLILVAFTSTSLLAQNVIDRKFSQFVDKENTTSVFVSGKVFEYVSYIETDEPEFEEIKDFITTIESFNLIAVQEHPDPRTEYRAAVKKVEGEYEELMRINDKEGNMSFYIDEDNGIVRELIGVGNGEKEFIVFSLYGRMDLNQIGKMAGKIQSEGFDEIAKIRTKGAMDVKVFPNPANSDGELTLEVPESLDGGQAKIYDFDGRLLKTITVSQGQQNLETKGLNSGNYIIELQKDGVSIKKKFIIVD